MLRSTPLRWKLVTALVIPMVVVGGYLTADILDAVERRDVAAAQRAEVDTFEAVSELSSAIGTENLLMNTRDTSVEQLAMAREETDRAYESLWHELPLGSERLQLIDGHYGSLLAIRDTLGTDPTEARLRAAIELRNGESRNGPHSTSLADLAELPLDVLAAFDFDPAAIDDVVTSSLVDDDFLVQRARADVQREAATLLRVATLPGNLVDADVTESVRAVLAQTDESLEVLAQLASIDVAGDVNSMMEAPAWTRYDEFRLAADAVGVGERLDIDESALRSAAADVDTMLRRQSADIVSELENRASASVFDADRDVVVAALIGLWLVVCVGLLLRFLYRAIKRPLERLTDRAGHIARVELPSVIDRMRSGEIDTVPEVERIKADTNDEVGSLVGAFNEMHRSAVELAAGQAASRRVVADMFVNLGRRNQRLVGRLLNGLSQLERNEQDPDALAALYDLDHTATRMRRNAESLLVLAGAAQARRWDEPIPVEDVARAAIGEVENYQRVTIDVNGDDRLDGGAVSDVTHLLAELVENALTFSPPASPVEIVAGMTSSGYVIAVTDNGIGMLPEQVDEVNGRIAGAASEDETPSDFLGHYVVGRLAARHGITVVLGEGPAGGVTARVWLPASIVIGAAQRSAGATPAGAAPSDGLGAPIDVALPNPVPVPPPEDPQPVVAAPAAVPDPPRLMPPPVDPMRSPLVGTDPVAAALPDMPPVTFEPSSDATDFLESLERQGIQPRTARFADDPARSMPAPTTAEDTTSDPTSDPRSDPEDRGTGPLAEPTPPRPADVAPLAAAVVATAEVAVAEQVPVDVVAEVAADLPVAPTAPTSGTPVAAAAAPSVEMSPERPVATAPPVTTTAEPVVAAAPSVETSAEPVAAAAPAVETSAEPVVPAAPPVESGESGEPTPFGVPPRRPGANLPQTELISSIVGSMGSVATPTDPSPSPASPPPAAPSTNGAASDPERVRSALSGFQHGIARADREDGVER